MNGAAKTNGFEIETLTNGVWTNFCSALTPREAAEMKAVAEGNGARVARIWSNKLGKEMVF